MLVNFNDGKFIVRLDESTLQIDREAYSINVTSQPESDLKNYPLPDIQSFEIELTKVNLKIWCFSYYYNNNCLEHIIFNGNYNNFPIKLSCEYEEIYQVVEFWMGKNKNKEIYCGLSMRSDLHWSYPLLKISDEGLKNLIEQFKLIAKINNLPWFDTPSI